MKRDSKRLDFLSNPAEGREMSEDLLRATVDYYHKKYGIKVYVNGDENQNLRNTRKAEKESLAAMEHEEAAIQEMLTICGRLKTESVGYIYTGLQNARHHQVFILRRDNTTLEIIRPICWERDDTLDDRLFKVSYNVLSKKNSSVQIRYYSAPAFFSLDSLPPRPAQMQVDGESCGTLGLLCLKQLLRDDARALTTHSFKFLYYVSIMDKVCELNEIKSRGMFIPALNFLRYSQYKKYDEALKNFLLSDEDTFLAAIKDPCRPELNVNNPTLRYLLCQSIGVATRKQSDPAQNTEAQIVIEQNQSFLEKLPALRIEWMKMFAMEAEKQKKMMTPTGWRHMLAYKTRRFTLLAGENASSTAAAADAVKPTPKK